MKCTRWGGADRFCVFNTHFDHAGPDARTNSAWLVRSLVARVAVATHAILAGDFNCTESEPPYVALTAAQGPGQPLRDARTVTHNGPFEPLGTFCGFAPAREIQGPRIDYIFVTEGIAVDRYETLAAARPEGFLSDHLVRGLAPGTIVRLAAPSGEFVLPNPPPQAWASGSGAAPQHATPAGS